MRHSALTSQRGRVNIDLGRTLTSRSQAIIWTGVHTVSRRMYALHPNPIFSIADLNRD